LPAQSAGSRVPASGVTSSLIDSESGANFLNQSLIVVTQNPAKQMLAIMLVDTKSG